ncbi:hypothetical protein ACWEO1_00905 [Kitasatospora cineracea]
MTYQPDPSGPYRPDPSGPYRPDSIGPFTLFDPAGALPGRGWTVLRETDWIPGAPATRTPEWLPATFASRDAALLGIGLILDGEHTVKLHEFWNHYPAGYPITVDDLIDFIARKRAVDYVQTLAPTAHPNQRPYAGEVAPQEAQDEDLGK